MATVEAIYRFLDEKAPFALQADFDNAGFLVGRADKKVDRVLVSLDITPEIIAEAVEERAQLIVSHHPVIWGRIAAVTDQDQTGQNLLALMEHGIAAICAHTNLDAVEGGVNTALAEKLGLTGSVPLYKEGTDEAGIDYGIGRVGRRAKGATSLSTFVQEVKEALGFSGIRVLDAGRPVYHVAVGGGACGDMLSHVAAHGCDTFVTSDLKHNLYLEAKGFGINLMDAGHYSTEAVICPVLVQWLKESFPSLKVLLAQNQKEAFTCL